MGLHDGQKTRAVRLRDLQPSQYQAFILALRYLASKGSTTYCFTYKGLRSWIYYNHNIKPKPEWHTIERSIRSLAEAGVFRRIRKGRRIIFCPGPLFFHLKYEYKKVLSNANLEGNSEFRGLLEYLEETP